MDDFLMSEFWGVRFWGTSLGWPKKTQGSPVTWLDSWTSPPRVQGVKLLSNVAEDSKIRCLRKKNTKKLCSPLKKTTKPDSLTTSLHPFFAQVTVGSDIDRPLPEAPIFPKLSLLKKFAQINSYASKKVTTHPWSTPQAIPLPNYERIPFTTCW